MWWSRKETGPPPAPAPAALPVTRAEWRSVPPIQRVVAEHPLVNPVQRFGSSLTSWQSPGYLEPLGHRVGPEEPAGVIGDLAEPRTVETPAPAMPVVQRATRNRSGLSRLWAAPVQREISPEIAVPEAPVPAAEPAGPPLVLPVVESPEVVRPLTFADAAGVPPVRTVQAIAEPSSVDAAAEVAAPDPVVPEPARPVLPVVQRTEQAAPRRLGLGAPLLPDSGTVPPPAAALKTGHIETPVLPAEGAAEPPLPVSRLADGVPAPSAPLSSPSVERLGDTAAPPRPPVPGLPVSRTLDAPPGRSSPVNTFRPLDTPEIRSGTTEPPGTPGGSTSVSPPPAPSLPVARAVETPAPPLAPAIGDSTAPVVRAVADSPASVAGSGEGALLPVARAIETPAGPGTRAAAQATPLPATRPIETPAAVQAPPLPVLRAVENPALPVTPAAAERPLPVTQGADAPALPVTAASEPLLPVLRAVETPALLVARVIEDTPPPVAGAAQEPPLPVIRAADTPALPVTGVAQEPRLPVLRAAETPALPMARATELPTLAVTRSAEAAALPVFRALDKPPLPVTRTIDSAAPVVRAGEGSLLPVARAVEDSPAPAAGAAAQGAPLPVARAIEGLTGPATPPLPVTRAIETSALPVARAVEGLRPSPLSAARATETPAPPVARTVEGAVAPVARAAEMPLPVARTLDTPVPWPESPVRSGENAPPTLALFRTVEAPEAPLPLPVARIAEHSRPSTTDFPHGGTPAPSVPPIIQREPEAAPEPAPTPAAAPPAAAAPTETEELVKKLFDPLLRRLKTELRLDRERRGALTDRPH
ncbi:hypothetical protein AB0M80_21025 [Amycolatopsis sp. NPDC051045]|uniref:hypothetical protein n=1 Tax=Amycolatopsis sp. NPDC051045 TaxID=3156922 RepID=UPI003428016B